MHPWRKYPSKGYAGKQQQQAMITTSVSQLFKAFQWTNANIRELAMIAVEQLITKCSHDVDSLNYGTISGDTSPEFDFGNIFKCISSVVEVVKDVREAISKLQSGDIGGSIAELTQAAQAVAKCLGGSSSGGADGSLPKEISSILKVAKIAINIVSRLVKMF
ncbi:hypothetical protein COCNU_02G014180 [Cocos nucifera]|uniref:Uncharacterized protein n=1 Tax=Cocos nucifera TaxID=13894 RepID=A0A8K0I0A8_COCNU|nr:hypothetical protein COCNU_02G014180 [Cocos nucifera]